MNSPLVWLDMEMTGLDPNTCVPVEVAIIITDDNLVEKASWESPIWQPDSVLETMSPFVRDMHTQNGLLQKVRASKLDLFAAEKRMVQLLMQFAAPHQGVLAGNSVHHDKRFLLHYFPVFHGLLHYRLVDVSSLKDLIGRWYADKHKYAKPQSDHTALSDIRASIDELRHYRKQFFVEPTQIAGKGA